MLPFFLCSYFVTHHAVTIEGWSGGRWTETAGQGRGGDAETVRLGLGKWDEMAMHAQRTGLAG